MKKIFYFMSLAAVVFAMASCKDKKEEPVPQDEKVIPQQIRLADAFQEYFMSEGETALIQYTVTPSNVNVNYTLAWASSDEKVVKVDSKGKVTAVAEGSATVTVSINEYPEVKPAVASITILAPAKVGDYIYNDGSWGENPNPDGKKVIAVIYWLGNASLFDPILEVDYPNCTHGLAMSIKQGKAGEWMKDFHSYFLGTDIEYASLEEVFMNMGNGPLCDGAGTLTEWGVVNSSYADLIRPYFENKDLWAGGGWCGLGGYTYTSVLEEYTRTYDDAGKFPFEFYLNAMNLVKDIEAPLTTSRWYVPSIFEAALMVNTALTKPGDFNNTAVDDDMNPIINNNNDNVAVVNAALQKVQGADLLPTTDEYAIASATDGYAPFKEQLDFMDCHDFFECMYVCRIDTTHTPSEAAAINAYWDNWLKDNAGDKYEEYKNYVETGNEWNYQKIDKRFEVYLKIRGYEDVPYEKVEGSGLIAAVVMIVAQSYANVGVADGKMHARIAKIDGYWPYVSGQKGEDNEGDVVRAIIAF